MIGRNDLCWCGSNKKWKKCHYPQEYIPPKTLNAKEYYKKYNILIKTPEQIEGIRKASRITADILDTLCKQSQPGVSTLELDNLANELYKKHGAIPAPLNYGNPPYPKSICTSINEVICHGIPNNKPLNEGDILNIDTTSIVDGYYGDCSRMVCIGSVSNEAQKLVDTCYNSLMSSIAALKPGVPLSKIGDIISAICEKEGFSVVYDFVGHGIGIDFHEAPQVCHARNNHHIPLVEGMTFTIEPMINIGKVQGVVDENDGWTVKTIDGKLSAQWEHTLVITQDGVEILTLSPGEKAY